MTLQVNQTFVFITGNDINFRCCLSSFSLSSAVVSPHEAAEAYSKRDINLAFRSYSMLPGTEVHEISKPYIVLSKCWLSITTIIIMDLTRSRCEFCFFTYQTMQRSSSTKLFYSDSFTCFFSSPSSRTLFSCCSSYSSSNSPSTSHSTSSWHFLLLRVLYILVLLILFLPFPPPLLRTLHRLFSLFGFFLL